MTYHCACNNKEAECEYPKCHNGEWDARQRDQNPSREIEMDVTKKRDSSKPAEEQGVRGRRGGRVMVCEKCGGCVTWRGPLSCLTHTQCESCGGINCQIAEYDCLEEDCPVPAEPVNARLLDALKLAECVYRKNVVNEGEPSSVLEAMQAAITAAEAHRPTDYSSTVDRAWARFCGAFGDGPDAPYPGMIAAFETHYGQSFRDAAWRTEAACWAAAWHKATEQASRIKPPSTDE